MKSPFHHIKHPEPFFEYLHTKIHYAFLVFALAIIGMLWWTSNILTQTSASWQWWGFITSDFWDQGPTDGNIKYALFGNGSAGATAYTRLWSSSCIPSNVIYTNSLSWLTWAANTIYIVNAWTYNLTNSIVMNGDCSAIIGKGDVFINGNGNSIITNNHNKLIIDNIKFRWNWTQTWLNFFTISNVTLNNLDVFKNDKWIFMVDWSVYISNSRIFDNNDGIYAMDWILSGTPMINNSLIYNNTNHGVLSVRSVINNSQIFNNGIWATATNSVLNNSIFYNNLLWLETSSWEMNNCSFYNNLTGVESGYPISYYWTVKFFLNSSDTASWVTFSWWTTHPSISSRLPGQIDTWTISMEYDWMTNPQNGSGKWLLSWATRATLRWTQWFDDTKKPIRYIFWWNIIKQTMPIYVDRILGTSYEYGYNWSDYIPTRYIAEPESSLPSDQRTLVNKYFWSGSLFTQNWQTNWCSLSAFQVKVLDPATFGWFVPYNFEDHTIYILTGGEYLSSASIGNGNSFVFNGNCIALIGNNNTVFTKSNMLAVNSVLYANNKRNIIIDNIKVDGTYYNANVPSVSAQSAIKFDGSNNNSTINNVQAYNASSYGIYLGQGAHHNTIINSQAFNNLSAGIHLYYSSDYNVINNTQTYNNAEYGIWFANGSNRNTMNNFQAYNNAIWVFWDLTTQENVINRAAIYNNSDAGIYFKNASSNVLNDVKIYHNTVGLRALYSSMGNKYYGDLKLFDNIWNNFDWTNAADGNLSAGTAWLFAYAWTLSTGTTLMTCLDGTNPMLSWNWQQLLTNGTCSVMWFIPGFRSEYNTYINYAFGLNMYKQKVPVRYDSGNVLVKIPSQYDSGKYIAEVFAVRDNTPEGMIFASSGWIDLNTWYTTNVYTAGVLNIAVTGILTLYPSTTSGYLMISWNNVGLTWTINNGDILQIRLLTRAWYNETVTWSITVWSATSQFTVTTRGLYQTPTTGSFAFANLTSIPINTYTWSTTTISGIETWATASIIFSPNTTSGRLEIYSWGVLVNSGVAWLTVHNGDQVTAIGKSSSGYAQTITWYVTIGLWTGIFTITTKWSDIVPPTTPTLTYPLSGEELFFITFEWTASTDTGSGIEGYVYEIAEDSNFMAIVNTGFISTVTGTMGSPSTDFDATSDTYYWRIKAKDRDGNLSTTRSNAWKFEAIDFDERESADKENANLRTYYDSDEISLQGMKDWATLWASVDNNSSLYKDGDDKGTGAFVQNDDTIYTTIRSSNRYDKTVTSTLTIANRVLEFNVITKEDSNDECSLSDDDKDTIETIYTSLVENYSWDDDKYEEFLSTMQSMLADEIDFTNDCNLQYLEDLINKDIDINVVGTVNTWAHIAPNCKEYPISFDSWKMAYTSPSFKLITYFANRDSLTRYIDFNNPGDCHINTYGASSWVFTNNDPSKHIAPNGKIYQISSDSQWYTSNDFTFKKYFSTISALRTYIDGKNIPQEIRSHEVDTSFTPQTFTAPNWKSYTIYKTNRWYMSYKLIKVRYFSTLSDIQSFIIKNNP